MKTRPIPVPTDWRSLTPHPLSALVEFGAGIDVDALAEHMRLHGYDPDEAIILHDGMILDGRHRLPAAIQAGVTPTFKVFEGRNATAYVAKKLFRQHLDTSQRAMMAATLAKLSPLAGVQNCTPPTLAEAAQTLNVSRRSVANAMKVQDAGTPALNRAVRDGTITVDDAAKVAVESPEVQDQALEAVRRGLASTASVAAALDRDRDDRSASVDAQDSRRELEARRHRRPNDHLPSSPREFNRLLAKATDEVHGLDRWFGPERRKRPGMAPDVLRGAEPQDVLRLLEEAKTSLREWYERRKKQSDEAD